jgi:colanic acid/amylovoran biosynthesis glycosyltransferase
MKTVVHFAHTFLNPSETFIRTQFMSISGFKPLAVCCRFLKNPLTEGLDTFQVPPFDIHMHRIFRFMPLTAIMLSRRNIALVHAHFGKNGWRAISLSALLRVPLIVSFYGRDATAVPRNSRWQKKYNSLFRHARFVLVLSYHMKNLLAELGCPSEKIIVHELGVDTNAIQFAPLELPLQGPVKLLLLGRFTEKKGIPTAIRAMENLTDCHLTIAGGGQMEQKLLDEVQGRGLQNRIFFPGWLSPKDVVKKMRQSHILLAPSETATDGDMEGSPTTIFEAMASGLPVVSTFHAGIPEQIENGVSGMLFPPGDSQELVRCVRALTLSREVHSSVARSARTRVETLFDSGLLAVKLENIYRDAGN